jgi:glycogen debranching enzyme
LASEPAISDVELHQVVTSDVPSGERTHALRHDDCFGLFNEIGDIDAETRSEAGLYRAGVRHLSRLTLTVASQRPLLLAASPREDNVLLTVNLTNADVRGEGGRVILPRGTLHITRTRFLWNGVCYELIRVRNFALSTVSAELVVRFYSDFENIVDVRSQRRMDGARRRFERVERDSVAQSCLGADDVVRETIIDCHTPAPDAISADSLKYRLQIGSRGEKTISLAYGCAAANRPVQIGTFTRSLAAAEELARREGRPPTDIHASDPPFNSWVRRAGADLGMMLTATPQGRVPAAGLPWLDATFGRDAIITALQMLWAWPEIARDVLRFLAATQCVDSSPGQGAETGKILNEARGGTQPPNYFGIDVTPLYVMLAGAYYTRTADLDFMTELWPSLNAALRWIDVYGDVDGDGFIETRPRGAEPAHHGWKSSPDAVFHADGRLASGALALCEVQGYVYAARLGAARIARSLGDVPRAIALVESAQALQARFNSAYWCADIETYALALDGDKQPCRVRSSNAGHCLFSGIAHAERARQIIAGLGDEHFFSGWGVRTVAESELRYNPMSYHNGSVWPHDNSLIAAGAARYDDKSFALRILSAQYEAARHFDLSRLPELFCGFKRRVREAPLQFPVACSPQAAASGAVFLMLQSVLGITIDALDRQIVLAHPVVPDGFNEISVRSLAVGDAAVDFTVRRHAGSVSVSVDRREGKIDLVIRS